MADEYVPPGVGPAGQLANDLFDAQARLSVLREQASAYTATADKCLRTDVDQLRQELRMTARTAGLTTPAIAVLCANVDSRLQALAGPILGTLGTLHTELNSQVEAIQVQLGAARDRYQEAAGKTRRVRHHRTKRGE